MIIHAKCEKQYDHYRSVGIEIDRTRQRMLSMYHYVLSVRIRLWWVDLRLSGSWSTYV